MECYFVDFFYGIPAFIAGMWKDKLQTDRFAKAFANDFEKKLDPTHKPRKETFALGMDLVHEIIERLFMSLDQIDEYLYSLVRIVLAD
jgi:hypothetical protein